MSSEQRSVGKSPSASLSHLPGTHTSTSAQAKGLLVSIPVLTPLQLWLLCRSIGTGWKGKKKEEEKDTEKKDSKNKLSALKGEMHQAEAAGDAGRVQSSSAGGQEPTQHLMLLQQLSQSPSRGTCSAHLRW